MSKKLQVKSATLKTNKKPIISDHKNSNSLEQFGEEQQKVLRKKFNLHISAVKAPFTHKNFDVLFDEKKHDVVSVEVPFAVRRQMIAANTSNHFGELLFQSLMSSHFISELPEVYLDGIYTEQSTPLKELQRKINKRTFFPEDRKLFMQTAFTWKSYVVVISCCFHY
jgi:hypothetical protein